MAVARCVVLVHSFCIFFLNTNSLLGAQKNVLYDRNGEEHYNIISALHKSIRGSDVQAALYYLGRMLGSPWPLSLLSMH